VLEQQNDDRLNDLHGKIKALHAVTLDIHNDSRQQHSLIDNTTNTFDTFRSNLSNSATRLTRSIQSGQGQGRAILYGVGAVVVLFLLWRMFR